MGNRPSEHNPLFPGDARLAGDTGGIQEFTFQALDSSLGDLL
jgi:hypothetical protein